MKKSYASPKVFNYGEVSDVVQYRLFNYRYWDFLTKRRYWLPQGI